LNIEIVDMLGRVNVNKEIGELKLGKNSFQISTANLINGVYTIKLELEGKSGGCSNLYKVVIRR